MTKNNKFHRVFGYLRSKPTVDADWYRLEYPDVAMAGVSPINHYFSHGRREGRHPSFDPGFYIDEYSDVADAGIDPLEHYLHHGRHEGRHPRFDAVWYLAEYDDVGTTGIDPREHYKNFGRKEGRHPAFDRRFYAQNYPDIEAAGVDVYQHYLHHGRNEGRQPAFQRTWYLAEYPDVASSGVDPYQHYFLVGKREGRHPGFDRRWYTTEYPDVPNYGMDLLDHYVRYGKYEGRHPAFNHFWYANEYVDTRTAGIDAHTHYRQFGKKLGRKPGPLASEGRPYRTPLRDFAASYESHFEPQDNFSSYHTDIKAIAFYLPQFHESAHNNRYWGKGFTEWVNTRKSVPHFPGHYQPRVPHEDIGYYDLSDPNVIASQADMARRHGIHGFCFYHYWFSGERVLEKPVDLLLQNPQIDINFMLCWANENWTRTWDGQERDVLLEQKCSEDDPMNFIRDISRYLVDDRYIKHDGCPILLVYKPHLLPNFEQCVDIWKRYWRETHGKELIIWVNRTDPSDHPGFNLPPSIDGIVEFPPNHIPASRHTFPYLMESSYIYKGQKLAGHLFDYQAMANSIIEECEISPPPIAKPFYRSVMLGWDNSARRGEGWSVWHGFSLKKYYAWLRKVIFDTRERLPKDDRYVFINAWNEWAEGTYLEPDERFGYASINTTARALFDLPFANIPEVIPENSALPTVILKVAVHFHVYYEELVDEIVSHLAMIPQPFDIFVTADSETKLESTKLKLSKLSNINSYYLRVFPNIGRDIAPLLSIGSELLAYDVFAHLHTKRSTTVTWGDDWRRYLLKHLLGSPQSISNTIARFASDQNLGVFYPENYSLISPHINWGECRERCAQLLNEMGTSIELPTNPSFAAGSFFWARPSAVSAILNSGWSADEFEQEAGQVQATLAHCIERMWCYVAAAKGYRSSSYVARIAIDKQPKADLPVKRRLSIFVHYDPDDRLSDADSYYLQSLREVSQKVVLVSNSQKPMRSKLHLHSDSDVVCMRWNRGYDFGAWRDALKLIGRDEVSSYDEIIFANNSCYGPLHSLEATMQKASEDADFWGITGFPASPDSPRPEAMNLPKRFIPEHIQSYFFVVRNNLAVSDVFWDFWEAVPDYQHLMDVVSYQEVQMTEKFRESGFKYEILVSESVELQRAKVSEPRYNAPYNSPLALLLAGSPFVKKKAIAYSPEETEKTALLIKTLKLLPFLTFDPT